MSSPRLFIVALLAMVFASPGSAHAAIRDVVRVIGAGLSSCSCKSFGGNLCVRAIPLAGNQCRLLIADSSAEAQHHRNIICQQKYRIQDLVWAYSKCVTPVEAEYISKRNAETEREAVQICGRRGQGHVVIAGWTPSYQCVPRSTSPSASGGHGSACPKNYCDDGAALLGMSPCRASPGCGGGRCGSPGCP